MKTKNLTPRETEILRDIANDLSTREIAQKYGVSAGTVAGHRHAILRKLGVRSSAAAVNIAFAKPA